MMPIDYTGFQLPKTQKPAKKRKAMRPVSCKQRKAAVANRPNKLTVKQRQGGVCFAVNVSPVCWGWISDPHELIPVGQGGPRETWNQVGVCRPCHRAAQGSVGGNRLAFDWPGKASGRKPNADRPGGVTCRWMERKDGRHGRRANPGAGSAADHQ